MTDFVLEQTELLYEKNQSKLIHRIVNYAQFLKQPLTLGMFVPCDDKGNILEEPIDEIGGVEKYTEKYQQAKERVLFEFDGELSLIKNKSNFYIIEDKNGVYLRVLKNKTKTTIESLLKFSVEITLTQLALKQIGL